MKSLNLVFLTLVLVGCCSADITAARKAKFLKNILAVYNMTIYPNTNYIILTGNIPDVLAENVQARVYDFAIDLQGPLTTAEYFYGLSPNDYTGQGTLVYVTAGVNVQHFMADGDEAWTNINYVGLNRDTGVTLNGTQVGHWRFNDDDKIIEVDNTQLYYDILLREMVPASAFPFYMATLINQTCSREVMNCVGANQQYTNYNACVAHILTLPFGSPLLNEWNSGVCRWFHSTLTFLRPDFHCPHVGPTGGGVCVDYTLASLYEPFFPHAHNRLVGPSHYYASIP